METTRTHVAPSMAKKTLVIIGAVLLVVLGFRFGIIGALIGAALASILLRKTGVVHPDSVWAKETKGLRLAKFIILGIVLLAIIGLAFVIFYQQ